MSKKKLTMQFSKSDHRDFVFERFATVSKKLPSSVDLRSLFKNIPIFDQGELGSCTANAWVRVQMILWTITYKMAIPMLSRLYLYVRERMLEGTVTEDAGAEPRDGGKSLQQNGVCAESLYPYDITKFTQLPTPLQDADATHYKINSYYSLNTLTGIKTCLAQGYPLLFGATFYNELEEVGADGFLKLPTAKSQVIGGHAICVLGYKDVSTTSKLWSALTRKPKSKGYLIIANSWGDAWGDHGYFYVPYEYLDVAQWEAWTAR